MVWDIFSKRQKRESGIVPEVYEYDQFPDTLRVQIIYILTDVIGQPNAGGSPANDVYKLIHHLLAREYGVVNLSEGTYDDERLFNFIRQTPVEKVIDAIEVSLRCAEYALTKNDYRYNNVPGAGMSISDAIKELNTRFQEAAAGYQYESDQMIRIDSQFIHAEIVKPALLLIADSRYHGAQEEFLNAHKHYREGNYKECLTDCGKSFESTIKAICEIRKWTYSKTDTAKALIDVCFKKGLFPAMLQAQHNALQTILESGVPTVRNKTGSHGQGPIPIVVPPQIAAYTLHLTAANIVLLINSERALP